MKKCFLWGTGKIFVQNVNTVKYHEICKNFEVVGITSNTDIYSEICGYPFYAKDSLKSIAFDFIVVMADGPVFKEILQELLELGISKDIILSYNVLNFYNIDFARFLELKKCPPSILSNDCWGAFTYHSLGLEFASPLINLTIYDEDYIKFLKNPKHYINQELKLAEMRYSEKDQSDFPVVECDDIKMWCWHYDSFDEFSESWNRRKKRIDWNNLFIKMHTESREIAKEFLKLPYSKKVCFVPFQTDDKELVYTEFVEKDSMKAVPFYDVTNRMAIGIYPYYDVLDLLEYGKITKIAKIK